MPKSETTMTSYSTPSNLRTLAANTPAEDAANTDSEMLLASANLEDLQKAISLARDPKARATLQNELASLQGASVDWSVFTPIDSAPTQTAVNWADFRPIAEPTQASVLDTLVANWGAGRDLKAPAGVTDATFSSGIATPERDPQAISAPGSVMDGFVPQDQSNIASQETGGMPLRADYVEKTKSQLRANPELAQKTAKLDTPVGNVAKGVVAQTAKRAAGNVLPATRDDVLTDVEQGTLPAAPAQSATLGDAASDIGYAATRLPWAIAAAGEAMYEGSNPDWKSAVIGFMRDEAKQNNAMPGSDSEYLLGITREKLRNLPQNLAFSLVSMGAALAAGAPAVLGTPAASITAGMAASGVAAYRMDTNGFMRDVRENLDAASVKARGTPFTDDEFITVAKSYEGLAREHGLYEALPEAIGNAVGIGAAKAIFENAKLGLKGAVKSLTSMGYELGTELGTEAFTQTGQHNVEIDAGIDQGKKRSFLSASDWADSAKEVAPDVLLLSGVVGAGSHVAGRLRSAPEAPVSPPRITPEQQTADITDPNKTLDQAIATAKAATELDATGATHAEAVMKNLADYQVQSEIVAEAAAASQPTASGLVTDSSLPLVGQPAPAVEVQPIVTGQEAPAVEPQRIASLDPQLTPYQEQLKALTTPVSQRTPFQLAILRYPASAPEVALLVEQQNSKANVEPNNGIATPVDLAKPMPLEQQKLADNEAGQFSTRRSATEEQAKPENEAVEINSLAARHAALDVRVDALSDDQAVAAGKALGFEYKRGEDIKDRIKQAHPDDQERALAAVVPGAASFSSGRFNDSPVTLAEVQQATEQQETPAGAAADNTAPEPAASETLSVEKAANPHFIGAGASAPHIAELLKADDGVSVHLVSDLASLPSATQALTGNRMNRHTAKAIRQMMALMGRKVQFYEANQETHQGINHDGATIYVNVDGAVDALAVAGHEFTHSLKHTDPESYNAAHSAVVSLLEANPKRAEKYRAYYGKTAENGNVDTLAHELLSDIGGNEMRKGQFWGDVFDQVHRDHAPGIARSIVIKIRDALVAFISKLTKATPKSGFNLEAYGFTRDDLVGIRDHLITAASQSFVRNERARLGLPPLSRDQGRGDARYSPTDSPSLPAPGEQKSDPEVGEIRPAGGEKHLAESGEGASFESRATTSLGINPAMLQPIRDIQDVVDKFKAHFKGVSELNIRVASTVDDIPARFRPSPYAEGVFHDDIGLIYLIADNMLTKGGQANTERALQVLAHETVGHYGLAQMMGNRFDGVLRTVMRVARDASVQDDVYEPGDPQYATVEAVRLRYPDASEIDVAQEVLARMAETDLGSSKLNYIRAIVRQWLRGVARAVGVDIQVTNDELNDLVALASAYLRDGKNLGVRRNSADLVAASRRSPEYSGVVASTARANPDISFSLARYQGEDAPAPSRLDNVQADYQDNFNRFTTINDWLKEKGLPITVRNNVYDAEIRMHGRFANKAEDFRKQTVEPLIHEAQKAGFSVEDVAQLLHAEHAEERNAQIAKINPVFNVTDRPGSGMDNATAKQIMAAASPELKAIAAKFRDITRETKKVLLDAGIVDQGMVGAWDATYKNYVPLRGNGQSALGNGSGQGLAANGKQKRALGHAVRDERVIENLLREYERALLLAEKNLVGQHLLALAIDANDPELISIGKPEKRGVLMPGKTSYIVEYHGSTLSVFQNRADASAFVQFMSKTGLTIRESKGDPAVQYMATPQLGDSEVNVYVGGHAVRLQIHDEMLASQYKKLGVEKLGAILEIGRTANTWLSRAYTGYSPDFLATNILRDFTAGIVNTTGEHGAVVAAKAVAHYPKSISELLAYSVTGKASPAVAEYRKYGGNVGAAYLSDIERIGQDVQGAFNHSIGVLRLTGRGQIGNAGKVAFEKLIGSVAGWIEHLNAAGENAFRLSVFKAVKAKTGSPEQAAVAAKTVTINFNKKGNFGTQIGALYLFYNPAVQDVARITKTLLKSEHKAQAWSLVGGMPALAFLTALLQFGSDDDGEWENIPQSIKSRNLIYRKEKGIYGTMPIPYGFGWFFGMGYAMYDLYLGKKKSAVAMHVASGFLDNFSPLGNPFADGAIQPQELVPFEPLRAWARHAANRTGFGGKIMPDHDSDLKKPDHLREWRSSKGSFYEMAANYMSEVTGGTKSTAGAVDVSPETLKYIVSTAGGGAAKFLFDLGGLGNLGYHAVVDKGETAGLVPSLREIPVVRKLAAEESVQWYRQRFYDKAKEATDAADAFRLASNEKAPDLAAIGKMTGRDKVLIGLAKGVSDYRAAIKANRDEQDLTNMDTEHSLSWRRLKLVDLEIRERKLYEAFFKLWKDTVPKAA